MKKQVSISIAVPAFNEEKNIGPTLDGILAEVPKITRDFEIIVIDDGSTDETGKIADKYSRKYPQIRVIHHRINQRFGTSIRDGLAVATKEYFIGFPGDNDTSPVSLRQIIGKAHGNYIINSYTSDPNARSFLRNTISKIFILLMNLLFGLNFRYFNGSFVCKTSMLKSISLKSKGLAIYAESKVRLLKKGYPYEEIPFDHISRKYGRSTALTWKSFKDTFETVVTLLTDTYIKRAW
jgi:glycosyltransferase involved in cell wall biosynthesis